MSRKLYYDVKDSYTFINAQKEKFKSLSDYTDLKFKKEGVELRLQVKLLPLNMDLSIDQNKAKYLHTNQIKNLEISLERFGFSGQIMFDLPYDTEKESMWNDLFCFKNKFSIEILYQEGDYRTGQYIKNDENCWSIRGYVDPSKDDAIELEDSIDDRSSYSVNNDYLSCKLSFTDAFAFFAKNHYPIQIFPQSTYRKLFEAVFRNFSNGLKIKIDNSVNFLDNKYNWICMNCQYPSYSFYDFFFYTLKYYQLQVVYDYSSTEPEYQIIDLKNFKNNKELKSVPKGLVKKIINKIGNYYFGNTNLVNHHWVNKNQSNSVVIKSADMVTNISRDYIMSHPVTSQFKNTEKRFTEKLKSQIDSLDFLKLYWRGLPQNFCLLPQSKFRLPEKYTKSLDNFKDGLVISSVEICFLSFDHNTIKSGERSDFTVSVQSDDITQKYYKTNHSVKIVTDVCLDTNMALSFPSNIAGPEKLNIYALIDNLDDSIKDSVYFITEGDKIKSCDISTDISSDDNYWSMNDSSSKELSYIVKLPLSLNGIEPKDFYITLPYYTLHDHQILPLRKNTPVLISLKQEMGEIDKVMWHSMQDKLYSKDTQVNKLTFGSNDCAGIEHQAPTTELKDATFKIFAETSNNKVEFVSNKEQMSWIYTEEK
ncbi:hypothetical protein LA02_1236 [Francisella philomiragia]|uniref:hypothetical protein n=1 Tax=Francisella philomiragia TaxID=28110 RepID=UPI0005A56484|nr:hypothetical protein [Francisella philomiragia]AJI56289.1 hypothetical protein LA02_1236 [Francisella philomiragia]